MNTSVEGIIVNNCQYAPIYLIQDPGATQANTYVLTPSNVEQSKPVSNNLKTFYENSGNIENGLVNIDAVARPAVKKRESVLIGNNLKLAGFLLPKNENINKQYVLDNIVLKPNINTTTNNLNTKVINTATNSINTATNNPVPINTVPKIDIDRKIVRLKEVPIINRSRPEKVLPKIKPKENVPSPTQSKHTSVQLIKLGETYHSLNHLSKEQIKMVNQALNMFKDPDKVAPEPTYDPVTNTRYIYKVVSPKDLTVVGQKKLVVKDKKLTKVPKRIVEEKILKHLIKEVKEEPPEPEPPVEAKVTRSGRKVKLPRQILPEDSPHKYKKKAGTIISCFQCSAEFSSLYRLQKHYENHPTHIPAKIHSNLFHCLLAIIKSGSEGDKTNIFIQQLEQLIVKLKSLLPCLLRKMDGSDGQACTITDDIGRLFGMNPGKYNIDVEALNCVKDKNGFCIHNPPKLHQYTKDLKPTLLQHGEELSDNETENCARINSVAKWPTVSKRIWKLKHKTHELSAKKMRLKSESETLIDLGTEDLMFHSEENSTADAISIRPEDEVDRLLESAPDCNVSCPPTSSSHPSDLILPEHTKAKGNYVQFHSAHFDIRSSPIKPSSTVFRKFQINPNKISNYQVQVIRSLETVDKDHNKHGSVPSTDNSMSVAMSTSNDDLHVTLPNTSNSLHVTLSNSDPRLHVTLPSPENNLHLRTDTDNCLHVTMPNTQNDMHVSLPCTDTGMHVRLPNSDDGLHVTLPNSNNGLHLNLPNLDNDLQRTLPNSNNHLDVTMQSSGNGLHMPLTNTVNSLDISLPNTDNSLLDIFKDDVVLSCKEDSNIDPVFKDWIISKSEKSHEDETFSKSSGLLEPAFLRDRDAPSPPADLPLDEPTGSHSDSVLNFLETLGNDLVSYPETEIRNNSVDFQLDLFTFHNS